MTPRRYIGRYAVRSTKPITVRSRLVEVDLATQGTARDEDIRRATPHELVLGPASGDRLGPRRPRDELVGPADTAATEGDCDRWSEGRIKMRVPERSELIVRVVPDPDDDQGDMAGLARLLRVELLDLDVDAVRPVYDDSAPDRAKGVAEILGTLAVWVGHVGLTMIMAKIRDWAGRTGGDVEVTIDGDTIKVSGKMSAQQNQLINAWLARHASDD